MLKYLLPFVLTTATVSANQAVTINFEAQVGDAPLVCGQRYPNVGSDSATIELQDARLYVSNVQFVDAAGREVPLVLTQDGLWQFKNVALLDFENATGGCAEVGTEATNSRVVGTVPAGDYRGLAFDLGVPSGLNHADASTAPSPLNVTSMFWNWQYGYKFVRIELLNGRTAADANMAVESEQAEQQAEGGGEMNMALPANFWPIHIGSTGCASPAPVVGPAGPCERPNLSSVRLAAFEPERDTVTLDVAGLLEGVAVGSSLELAPPGCMSGFDDPDCRAIFGNFSLSLATGEATPSQRLFRVTGRGARASR